MVFEVRKPMNFQKKNNVKGPTHNTVEAGACWSTGGSGGGSLSVIATETVAGGAIPKKEGIAQGVLLWFQYYIRCVRYKVLMRISASFHTQNGKTIAFLHNKVCIGLLMTMYKGDYSCEQPELVWSELKRQP